MEFSGVYHKTSEQMSYALDEDRLIVNIKTGYDVKQVFIHYGDPYEAGILGGKEKWIGKREEMIYKKRLPYQIWWTTTLLPEYKRCKYYFELRTEKEVWYYFEDGFLTEEQLRMDGRMQQCFNFHFPNGYENDRCVEYIKLDEEGNKIEVLLNASDEEIKVKGDGEVLFAREFDGEILGVNGTLIRRM